MPFYEFKCDRCGMIIEKEFKISECPKSVFCDNPDCDFNNAELTAHKIISVPAKPKEIFYHKVNNEKS